MWFRKKSVETRLDAELRYHFDRMVGDLIAKGVEPEEARRRARLEFGGLEQIKEECRDARGRWLEDLTKDLQYAVRTLRRSPGFLAVSVVSLALGIGANTAIFSLINALMLRSLPVNHPEQLVQITRTNQEGMPLSVSYPLFEYFRANMKSIAASAVEMEGEAVIVMNGAEDVVSAKMVSGDHYAVLGIAPAAGRVLNPSDDAAAVISYRYWQRHFGLDAGVIGKTFTLPRRNLVITIVGVTPRGYAGTTLGGDPDITLPLLPFLNDEQRNGADNNFLDMLGRLAPGYSLAQANAEVKVLWKPFLQRMVDKIPEHDRPEMLRFRAAALRGSSGFSRLRDNYAGALLVLMGIVALVLLLACANLSGLLLARAAAREREISIRLAIGAGGGRLLRQFLAESLVLAALGGTAGLFVGYWLSSGLVRMMTSGETLLLSTAPDWRVLAFTGFVSLAACVAAGLAPGMHALRANLNPGLKQARAASRRGLLGKGLVIAQVSISMVLVVGAALFAGTLVKLYSVDRGLRTDGVAIFTVRTSTKYSDERSREVASALVDRLSAMPGVTSASAVDVLPMSGSLWDRDVDVEGYQFRPGESHISAFNAVAPKYFSTLGTPLLRGRDFDRRDTNTAPKVTIVNDSFARYFFGGQSPLGRHVTSRNVTYEIVGVARDAQYTDLRQERLKTMYIPWMQRDLEQPTGFWFVASVAGGDPLRMAPAIERLVRETDPALRLRKAQSYAAVVNGTMVQERIMAALGSFFGVLAIIVACLGIFGSMAFQVSRRINEIGLRMALGASRSGIVTLVLRDVAWLAATGCAAGGVAALTLTGLTRKMLFGVTPRDPAVFGMAAVVLALAALMAGWLPARRASRVDPMVALRHE